MKPFFYASILLSLCVVTAHCQGTTDVKLQRTISLNGVSGKFDHFAIDEKGNRLFAAATGNQSVEAIDMGTDRIVESLKGLGKPHGLAWIPETGRLFVADGGKAALAVFEGSPLKLVKSIPLSEDTDDMVYDTETKLLYVGHGGTNAANPARVAIVDALSLTIVANLAVASHPEALELDRNGDRVFVNIADEGQIVVIDGKTHKVASVWKLKQNKGNTPLAYDEADDLLLVGCRAPSQLLVLNGKTGEEISSVATSSGADDLFYDSANRRVYLIAGSGAFDSFTLSPQGKLQPLTVTRTANGAKTGFLTPVSGELYIGIPGTSEPAAIRIYQTHTK